MPTKSLPAGTRNTSINAPDAWLCLAHREAHAHGLSLGEFVKQCIECTVQQRSPQTARQLRQFRTVVRIVLLAVLMLAARRINQQTVEAQPGSTQQAGRSAVFMIHGGGR